jgi:cysteine synthase A
VDLLIAGVGTGGTITGTGRYLKEKKPKTRIIAVEPAESQVLAGKPAGPHSIQGIGANFVPAVLDTSLLDAVVAVKSEAAFAAARQMAKTDGILCGISAGAALYAAIQIAEQAENRGKTIVVILPDGGEKYMSTDLFR